VILSTRYPQPTEISTGYPQVIHRLYTVCAKVIHRISTGYPQVMHSVQSGTENGAEWYRATCTDGFKAGYRGLSQRSPVTETTVQSTVQRGF